VTNTTKIKNSECVWSWKVKSRIKILRGPLEVGSKFYEP